MSVKENNEITVRVTCSDEELIKKLEEKGFKEGMKFTLDDYYLIPNTLNITERSSREILSKAVILRDVAGCRELSRKITFKIKDINEKGEIVKQKSINCSVLDISEARNLFESLGYYEIMNIKENDIIYYKDDLELAIKFIKNSNTLIEIETNSELDTVNKLKDKIKEIGLPIEDNVYFVKKAEEELNKILKKSTH